MKKLKVLLNDSIWSIAGLCTMNMVSQFVLYPTWANLLGREEYGNILFLLSIINIVSVSVGISLNNARLVNSIKEDTVNGEYNIILFFINIL